MEAKIPDGPKPDEHAGVWIQVKRCACCDLRMVFYPRNSSKTFPQYFRQNFHAQVQSLGLVKASDVENEGGPVCQPCADAGKVTFVCVLCKEKKTTDKIQESFGDPAECLCTDCFGTVTAKVWEEKVEELEADHRRDFE